MEAEYIPVAPQEPEMVLAESLTDRLTQNQVIRTMITSKLTKGGTDLPRTDEELKLLMTNMQHQDTVTLGEMKVKVDATNKGNDGLVQQTILELARTRGHIAAPPPPPTERRAIPSSPELDSLLDEEEDIPDQTFIGQQSLNYDDFRERFGNK